MRETKPQQAFLGQSLGVVAKDAAIVGVVQRQRRDAVGARCVGEFLPACINGRVRKAVLGINRNRAGLGVANDGHRIAHDFAAGNMLGIDRHVHKAVAADSIAFSAPGRARDGGRIGLAGAGFHQSGQGEVVDLIERECLIHESLRGFDWGQSLSLVPAPAPPSREASLSGT